MNINEFIESVTFPLSLVRSPVWLFDVDSLQVVWANEPALTLCEVLHLAELQTGNMEFDLSCKVREHIKQCKSGSSKFADTTLEYLTLYHDGQPTVYECFISAMATPCGHRLLMVNGIRHVSKSASDALYRNHALQHTSVCVSVYALDGRLKYSNPAASAMLGNMPVNLATRFQDTDMWHKVRATLSSGDVVRTEANMRTSKGVSWHGLSLEICPDPLRAKVSILVTELDLSARQQAQERVQQLAYHDALTGLPNRASWFKTLHATLAEGGRAPSVLFLDLDGFKPVNDTYGHDVGDKLLAAVGKRISDCLAEGEFLARLGGDEFTLLMFDDKDGCASAKKAQQINNSLAEPIFIDGHDLRTASSIGIAGGASAESVDAERLMRQADIAMYAAKKAGGGFVRYTPEMNVEFAEQRFNTRKSANDSRSTQRRCHNNSRLPGVAA